MKDWIFKHFQAFKRRFQVVQSVSPGLGKLRTCPYSLYDFSGRRRDVYLYVPALGGEVLCRLGRLESDLQVLQEIIAGEYRFDISHQVDTVLDIGANAGYAALWMQCQYPDAEIVCLEPDLDNYRVMQANVREKQNISSILGAVSSSPGVYKVERGDFKPAGLRAARSDRSAPARFDGVAFTVLGLMRLLQWRKVDLLKVDIEGGEAEVFSSSEEWIHLVNAVICETHDRYVTGSSKTVLTAVQDFGEVSKCENNVFATRAS
jgi:FkbM family methyltransferase